MSVRAWANENALASFVRSLDPEVACSVHPAKLGVVAKLEDEHNVVVVEIGMGDDDELVRAKLASLRRRLLALMPPAPNSDP